MNEEKFQREFLIWFLEKADSAYINVEPQVHTMANEFLGSIFVRLGKQVPGFETVKTEAGYESNHIRIELDEKYVILLQSLTSGQPSNDSLTNEVDREFNHYETEADHLFPIFLKTKYEFIVDENELIYPILYRKKLLDCLFSPSARGVQSGRLIEFRSWLLEAEEEFSAFRNSAPSIWSYKEWIGYSNFMEKEMNWGSYEFRSDEKGGRFEFLGSENI